MRSNYHTKACKAEGSPFFLCHDLITASVFSFFDILYQVVHTKLPTNLTSNCSTWALTTREGGYLLPSPSLRQYNIYLQYDTPRETRDPTITRLSLRGVAFLQISGLRKKTLDPPFKKKTYCTALGLGSKKTKIGVLK